MRYIIEKGLKLMFAKQKLTFAAPLSVALISAIGLSTPAMAQEHSLWSGFYVGANAGGAWSNSDADAALSVNSSAPIPSNPIVDGDITSINDANVKGHLDSGHHNTFTGGLEAGYNYVMSNGLLLGIETDINIFDINRGKTGTVQSPALVTYTVNQSVNTDFLWTLRPRIGYAMDKFLIFASGGLALTEAHYDASFYDSSSGANTANFTHSHTRTGWTLGGGAAYAITPKISVKGEYLYQDFGTVTESATSANGYVTLATETNLKSHLFRAGVDYRF
jgi:outer membrane immunogenic protein